MTMPTRHSHTSAPPGLPAARSQAPHLSPARPATSGRVRDACPTQGRATEPGGGTGSVGRGRCVVHAGVGHRPAPLGTGVAWAHVAADDVDIGRVGPPGGEDAGANSRTVPARSARRRHPAGLAAGAHRSPSQSMWRWQALDHCTRVAWPDRRYGCNTLAPWRNGRWQLSQPWPQAGTRRQCQ